MSEQVIRYDSQDKSEWRVWGIKGRLDRTTAAEAILEGESIFQGSRKFAIDLSAVEYLSSAGVRVLLKLAKEAEDGGIPFALVVAQGMVRSVLEISRIDLFIRICSSVDELDES